MKRLKASGYLLCYLHLICLLVVLFATARPDSAFGTISLGINKKRKGVVVKRKNGFRKKRKLTVVRTLEQWKRYRLGDIVKAWEKPGTNRTGALRKAAMNLWPNSIAAEYLRRTRAKDDWEVLCGIVRERLDDACANRTNRIRRAKDQGGELKVKEKEAPLALLPLNHQTAVVHLRLGDVCNWKQRDQQWRFGSSEVDVEKHIGRMRPWSWYKSK